VPISLFLCCAVVVCNLAVSDAFCERTLAEQKRKDAGLALRTRRRCRLPVRRDHLAAGGL